MPAVHRSRADEWPNQRIAVKEGHAVSWLKEVFGRNKVGIGMVNCPPMPGTPWYDEKGGLPFITNRVEHDLLALQEGGIDGVLFHNENDRPFVTDIGPEIVATMTRAITQVLPQVRVPFGVDVLADTRAALAIALATGAKFVRDDMGTWINNAGELSTASLLKTDPTTWDRLLAVNLTAPFLLSQALVPAMLSIRDMAWAATLARMVGSSRRVCA